MTFEEFLEGVQERMRSTLKQYEEREAQNQMFATVMEALQKDKHLLIEAGTGTGKSLGYLLPALYQSVKTGQKVTVSTHTINLQEQLRERDIPLLTQVMDFPFRAAIFKGRGHYLCLRKFEHKINKREFATPKEDLITAAQMIVWLTMTETGDDEELNLSSRGGDFWETVASDSDSCLGRSCPWFRKCFYHRARHEAGTADVIVTNHSKLFTDVKASHQLLPSYEHLIIDEAHHLEEVAGKHLGLHMKYFTFIHPLTRLFKDSKTGQLPALRQMLNQSGMEQATGWSSTIDSMYGEAVEAKEAWDKLSEMLFAMLPERSDASPGESGQFSSRLKPSDKPKGWSDAGALEQQIYLILGELIRQGDRLLQEVEDELEDFGTESLMIDLKGLFKDLAGFRENLRFFMKMEDETTVYWLEASGQFRSKSLQFYAVPVDVSRQLKEMFLIRRAVWY